MSRWVDGDDYIVDGLLRCHCGIPMVARVRGGDRVYRCAATSCGRVIDALLIECEVWERVLKLRPHLVQAGTPREKQAAALEPVLRQVRLGHSDITFRLAWRQPARATKIRS